MDFPPLQSLWLYSHGSADPRQEKTSIIVIFPPKGNAGVCWEMKISQFCYTILYTDVYYQLSIGGLEAGKLTETEVAAAACWLISCVAGWLGDNSSQARPVGKSCDVEFRLGRKYTVSDMDMDMDIMHQPGSRK